MGIRTRSCEDSLGGRFGGGMGVPSKSGVSLSTLGGVKWGKGVWAEALSLGEGHRDTRLPAGPSSLLLCFPRLWVARNVDTALLSQGRTLGSACQGLCWAPE